MKLLVSILVICVALSTVFSLKCYECKTYGGKRDAPCPVVTCPKGYSLCTTTKYSPIPSIQTHDCYYKEDKGTSYRGTANITLFGSNCISWDSANLTYNSKDYPNRGLGDHNFCRNPDGDLRPWCYTSTQSDYAFCDVPECFPHITNVEETACGWNDRQYCNAGGLGSKCGTICHLATVFLCVVLGLMPILTIHYSEKSKQHKDLCNKPSTEGDPAESNKEN